MRLKTSGASRHGEDAVLAASIVYDDGEELELRISVAAEYEEWLDRSSSPFVPLATALATVAGEDLRLGSSAAPRLARGAAEASRMYAEWWGYRPAAVELEEEADPREAGPGTGLFFSNGADSTASLMRSREGIIPERVTHLLSLREINPHLSPATEAGVWRELEAAAAEYELPLVRLHTNGVAVLRERMGWTRSFGAILAATALAIGPLLRSVLIATTVDDLHLRPRGSHPELDPLWSTEATSFRDDGNEIGKVERVLFVGARPQALRHLKVCWEADIVGNCGRCFKCLKTMSTLVAGAGAEWRRAFEAPLTPEAILASDLRADQAKKVRIELLPLLGGHPELCDAWKRRIKQAERAERRRRRVRRLRPLRRRWRRLRRRARRRARRTRRRLTR